MPFNPRTCSATQLRKFLGLGAFATAFALVYWGCSTDATGPLEEGTGSKPALAFAAQGDSQVGSVGAELPAAVVVQVNDRWGVGARRVNVTFRVTEGGGSVSRSAALTDEDGRASTLWTLGTRAGIEQRLVATVRGASKINATFTATALPGAPAAILPDSGSGQTGRSGTRLSHDIVALVLDRYGNGVPGRMVLFMAPASSGTLDSTSATTDASGRARTGWTLGDSGPNIALALVNGMFGTAVVFVAKASPAPPPPTPGSGEQGAGSRPPNTTP